MCVYICLGDHLYSHSSVCSVIKKKWGGEETRVLPSLSQTNFHINTTKTTPVFPSTDDTKETTPQSSLAARKHRRGVWRQCPAHLLETRKGEQRFEGKKLTDVPGTMRGVTHEGLTKTRRQRGNVTVTASNCYHNHATTDKAPQTAAPTHEAWVPSL